MHNPRRKILKLLAAGPLCACAGESGEPASFGDVSAGNVDDTSVDTLTVVAGAPAILGRDADGLYAMTITCTHEGCDVGPSNGILVCPCHGSRFDKNGKVLGGPAGSPLVHFSVTLDPSGDITIHGKEQVAATVRTPVA